MKLLEINNHEECIRFSKDVKVKVNDFITVKGNVLGGLTQLKSKNFGTLITVEDVECDLQYYVGGKETKRRGFKELCETLYTEKFSDFERDIESFIYKQISKSFKTSVCNLSKDDKIELLKELFDSSETFVYESNEVISYIYDINQVLLSLGEPKLKLQRFEDNKVKYGVYKNNVKQIIEELCDTKKD